MLPSHLFRCPPFLSNFTVYQIILELIPCHYKLDSWEELTSFEEEEKKEQMVTFVASVSVLKLRLCFRPEVQESDKKGKLISNNI